MASYPDVLREMLVRQGIELPGLNKDQYKVALELNQTVWDGGKTAADKRIAEADAAQRARAADVALYEVEGRGGGEAPAPGRSAGGPAVDEALLRELVDQIVRRLT